MKECRTKTQVKTWPKEARISIKIGQKDVEASNPFPPKRIAKWMK